MDLSRQTYLAVLFSLSLVVSVGGERVLAQQELPGLQPQAAPAAETPAANQKMGYALGLSIGKDLKTDGVQVDVQSLLAGIMDGYSGNPPKMDEAAVSAAMEDFQRQMQAQYQTELNQVGVQNKRQADEFLAKNKQKPGVVETASGLQYEVLQEGSGQSPTIDDTVSAHYVGTLLDGTEFDSSLRRGQPIEFPVGGVIPGWTEALQKMKVGSKWRLYIPPALAYGENPPGPPIEPNSMLIFDVELKGIK